MEYYFKMADKTINIERKTWKKLMKWKYELGCKNMEELMDRILKIVPASKLKEGGKK